MDKKLARSEYVRNLIFIEEMNSEKLANYWRFMLSLLFMVVTKSVTPEIPALSVKVLWIGAISYCMFSIFMFFVLKAGHYTVRIKYFNVVLDIMLISFIMWSFGTFRTFKTQAFLLYYIWIALATVRLSVRLTIFSGMMSVLSYAFMFIAAVTFGTIETGTITDGFISTKVSTQDQALKITFMTMVIFILTYGSRAYKRLASKAYEHEMEAERQGMRNQKLESIGFLAGGIAHDFNNALAIMTNNLHIIMSCTNDKEKVAAKAQAAISAAMKATSLTQQLLTFSKGGAPLKKTIPVYKILEDSAWLALTGSAIKYNIAPLPADLKHIKVDVGQISQVLNNIFINAAYASPVGGTITIKAENFTVDNKSSLPIDPGEYVKLSVTDQGSGISPEIISKIFDPYFTTKETGSGLGLATAHSIIKRHNGHIEVTSTPNKNTTFNLYLPATQEQCLDETDSMKSTDHGSLKILIMDDEQAFLDSTGEALVISGHDVAFAHDGDEALELYRSRMYSCNAFDVVIMDLTIPGGMGGTEAIRRLKAMDPDAKAIVSSGYSNDPVMSNFKDAGFSGILPKPFTLKQMLQEISKVLNNGVS